MANTFEVTAEKRQGVGRGASRRLRRAEQVPAIVYGAGKEPQNILVGHNHIQQALKVEAFYSHILTLNVAGQEEKVVLKAVQRHPYKPKILHLDFLRISANEKIYMHVPLHFIGADVAPGVKQGGGQVTHQMVEVEIRCLPADLPEFIQVDLSQVQLDQTVHLSDLKVPAGVELVDLAHHRNSPVASIHVPRATQTVEEEAAAAAAATAASAAAAPEAAKAGAKPEEKATDKGKK